MKKLDVNGAQIPVIGLGTWTLKGGTCVDIVSHALEHGYRHVDTATIYDNEEEVGEGIRASGLARDQIFLTTKVWWTDLAPGDLERSAAESLKRLGVDAVDLLLIHWPSPDIPLAETIGALNRAREKGLTRHIGVSNFPSRLLEAAAGHSTAPLVANQVEYHPYLNQEKVHAACLRQGMAMVSYCPLYRGGLLDEPAITEAAARHGKTPAQIVLRWHIEQENVAVIPRTSRLERLAENADIFDFSLDAGEMEAISRLKSAGRRICDYDFSPEWDQP
ncbi:aldo/keto reductase [Chelativorans sp. M5D2P16]|uniref:aldo/keto reductase n=1 Tax=Chelativorans sp. M5D2P16 TaxID=3095678 RepID=UPI002ACA80BD|nr:aldo/keto reductase [Chelativorans sp. M5D2P16]MDZ5696964.1 aldo/keto reductase [Chelativorans sp. M5D2P16]